MTYAIGGKRWTATSIARATAQYSSIVRSQPGRPLLYVYTNAPQLPIPSNTTFGAPVRIEVRNASIDTSVKGNLSVNLAGVSHRCRERYVRRGSWICLSRTKLEVMRAHSEAGERAVWIDLDTLVFKPVPPREFVVGYQHGKSRADGPSVFGGARIAPRHEAYGDLWSLDAATIDKILRMEDGMSDAELPDYDTQGLIAIALTRGVIDTPIVQDLDASQSYGFECVDRHGHPNSAIGHPGSGNMKMAVVNGDLACKGKPIAALSFTATNYAKPRCGATGGLQVGEQRRRQAVARRLLLQCAPRTRCRAKRRARASTRSARAARPSTSPRRRRGCARAPRSSGPTRTGRTAVRVARMQAKRTVHRGR